MSWLRVVLFSLVGIWGQAFFSAWRPAGVVPSIAIMVILLISLWRPASEAVMVSVITGIALDATSGNDFGLRTGYYSLLALIVVILVQTGFELERLVSFSLVVVAASFVWLVLLVGTSLASGGAISIGAVGGVILVEITFNVLLAWAMMPLMRRLLLKHQNDFQIGRI